MLLNTLPNPVYYKDKQGLFIQCNKAFCTLVDRSKEDIIGLSAYSFFPTTQADKHKLIDQKIMQTLGTNTDEIYMTLPDKSVRYFIFNKAVYLDADGTVGGTVCIMNDITDRIKQKHLSAQQSKLAEMGEMIASIAHQWNEPLVEISALTQRMQLAYSLGKTTEANISQFVQDTMVQVQYMSKALSDFRNFLKPSTTQDSFLLSSAIGEIFDMLDKQLSFMDITLSFECIEQELYIFGYKNQLQHVLLNIINNAKHKITKLDQERDRTHEATIIVRAYTANSFVWIDIIDNAGAIDEAIIDHLFDPYFTTRIDGMGFGLYIAKTIIEEKMNGYLSVKNDGENAIFTIQIPFKNKK